MSDQHSMDLQGEGAEAPQPAAPASHAGIAPQRRRRWPWFLLAAFVALLLLAAFATWMGQVRIEPVHLIINGEERTLTFDLASASFFSKLGVAMAVFCALTVLAVVVPFAILLAAGAVVLALVLSLGLPLMAVSLALAVVFSPVILIVWLVWWLVRRGRTAPSSTIGT